MMLKGMNLMKGKVIDKNITDAFIVFENGDTMDIKVSSLPRNVQVGDSVEIPFNNNHSLTNDKMVDFF
jgi:mannose-6-phosphate isomerase-like protein (cupin superfamily)